MASTPILLESAVTECACAAAHFEHCTQAHREGGESRGYFPGAPKLLSRNGAPRGFFIFLGCYFVFFLHYLDSVSERLGRIIGNAVGQWRSHAGARALATSGRAPPVLR